ncbi:hypothetical protein NAEGRDRAFT_58811 [Naegleria gruberi]|uniref:Uncharacterized protein n=1 Tax=Naegleria gruberi TaxID=5762 RepID=D2VP58_NAEGR|nr:uncharacterized protein NAEGRDRAFT_58811 [Naegleria gruberi]EFC41374.1 hypothetical protein NAEGRDRAFT_58811 [Naegleria gruberi]|eukprot:XP_002674118.1 hypothetical protein NAEGRDRAFT_58811 [Naegleria gruberi strain NEG-M]
MKKQQLVRNLLLHQHRNITTSTCSSSASLIRRNIFKKIIPAQSSSFSNYCSRNLSSSSWINHHCQEGKVSIFNLHNDNITKRSFSFSSKNLSDSNNNNTLSIQEEAELLENYQFLDNTFKQITSFIMQNRINHPDQTFQGSGLFDEILKLISYCHQTVPRADSTNTKFYNSSIGMKSYILMKKVELLLLKGVNQEWFSLEELQRAFNPEASVEPFRYLYPTGSKVDDTLLLFSIYEAQLSNSAFVPQIQNINLSTKESLIAACFFVFFRIRGGPGDLNELCNYAESLSSAYEITKNAYTNAKQITDMDTLKNNAHQNAFSYLDRTFSEEEFDWFEDVETDMPIHLGNFIRAIKATTELNAKFDTVNREAILDILEECVNAEPENIYLHYLYAYSVTATAQTLQYTQESQANEHYLVAISHLEKALQILSTMPMLPYPNISKNQFSEVESKQQVERINDLKFTPISLLLAHVYARASKTADSVEASQMHGNNGLYYSSQTELYSRHPNIPILYMNQGVCYHSCGMYESAIEAYATVDQYDFDLHNKNIVVEAFFGATNCMVDLGLADQCLEKIDIYIEKYKQDPRVFLQKLLCKAVLLKSKDELTPLLGEFKEFKESIESLKVTDPSVYNFVSYHLECIENLANARVETPNLDIK